MIRDLTSRKYRVASPHRFTNSGWAHPAQNLSGLEGRLIIRRAAGGFRVSEEAVYREFIEWFGRGWPLPESDELLPLMKARFSPEEAAFLTGMPHGLTPLEKLAEEREVDAAQLEKQLDALARQGVVYRQASDGEVRYKLSDAFFTFLRSSHWAGRDDQTTRALAPITNRYYRDGFFANWADAHLQGLRALPVEETIADTRQILPYEDVVELVETLDYFTVSFYAGRLPGRRPGRSCARRRSPAWCTASRTGWRVSTPSATAASAAACGSRDTTCWAIP
jgi:hypothetical protein